LPLHRAEITLQQSNLNLLVQYRRIMSPMMQPLLKEPRTLDRHSHHRKYDYRQ